MSTIDQNGAIAIIRRHGACNPPATITRTEKSTEMLACARCGQKHVFGVEHGNERTYKLFYGPRHFAGQIWQYRTGFGNLAYKVLYESYPNGDDEKIAAAKFLSFGNIAPGTECICLFENGKLTKDGEHWWKEATGDEAMPMAIAHGATK